MNARLWDKGDSLDKQIHSFTVGDDPEVDLAIAGWDAIASAAHARMLGTINVLDSAEVTALLNELNAIYQDIQDGNFVIPEELEDCHTTIEERLSSKLGETGKRIHTGRSRNDQVLVAVRLFLKHSCLTTLQSLVAITETLSEQAGRQASLPLPGYTHMQPAMPSSVGMWFHSFAEWFLTLVQDGLKLLESLDSNPLGVGSGFGVSIPLDRNLTTKLLGFSKTQRNPIAVQNSRGRYELKLLGWFTEIGLCVEKFAWDLLLYSSREYGFVTLPTAFTTGSSIMPQKRNPDVLELMRGSVSKLRGARDELEWVIAKLPSNYHRDFQLTKSPLVRAARSASDLLALVQPVSGGLTWNEQALRAAMSDDLYATYEVFRLVKAGMAFRDAYKTVGTQLKDGSFQRKDLERDFESIKTSLAEEEQSFCDEAGAAKTIVESQLSKLQDLPNRIFKE